jgi:hypothetical protein
VVNQGVPLLRRIPAVRRYQQKRFLALKNGVFQSVSDDPRVIPLHPIPGEGESLEAPAGPGEEELRQARIEAERQAEEERKQKELLEIKHNAGVLIATVEKVLGDYDGQRDREIHQKREEMAETRKKFETNLAELKKVLSSEDLVRAAEKALGDYTAPIDAVIAEKTEEKRETRLWIEEKRERLQAILSGEDTTAIQEALSELDAALQRIGGTGIKTGTEG